jgi:hypothetical protein
VRVYEVGAGGKSQGKAMYQHEGPVLSVCWSQVSPRARCVVWNLGADAPQDGTKIFSGGADNAGRMFDVGTGQATQIAAHEAPVKVVRWIDTPGSGGILATGSWDKTIKVRRALFLLALFFPLTPYAVLGPPHAHADRVRPAPGTLLQYGCSISADGRRDC